MTPAVAAPLDVAAPVTAAAVIATAPESQEGWHLADVDRWKAIFTVAFVATVLTIIELAIIYHIVFVGIKDDLSKAVRSQVEKNATDTPITRVVDSIIGSMYLRERDNVGSLNGIVLMMAVMFVLLLVTFTVYSGNKMHLAITELASRRNAQTEYSKAMWNAITVSLLTLFFIGVFQGFPCVLTGASPLTGILKNNFCFETSFIKVAERWLLDKNYTDIVWRTGLCDGYDRRAVSEDIVDQDLDQFVANLAMPHAKSAAKDAAVDVVANATNDVVADAVANAIDNTTVDDSLTGGVERAGAVLEGMLGSPSASSTAASS